jgi:hypothetical protein
MPASRRSSHDCDTFELSACPTATSPGACVGPERGKAVGFTVPSRAFDAERWSARTRSANDGIPES